MARQQVIRYCAISQLGRILNVFFFRLRYPKLNPLFLRLEFPRGFRLFHRRRDWCWGFLLHAAIRS